jgi:myosin heavy subunit
MLTGKFFSYTTAEDFDSKFVNLTFKQYIPSTDKEFLSNVILFLKKTLNPNPDRRFQSIKEFKDFIGSHFRIEELSTVTFNLSYFMNTLYGDMVEREDRTLQEELNYVIPEPKKEPERAAPAIREDLVSNILEDLEKEKKSRKSIWLAALLVVFVAVAGTIFFVVIQPQRAKKLEANRVAMLQKQQQDKESELMKRLDEMKNQLQQKDAVTEQDKKDREEQLRKLQTQIEESRRYQEQQRKAQEDEQKKKLEEQQLKQKEEEERKQKESEEQKKREEEEQRKKQQEIEQIRQDQLRTKEGQEVSMALVDVKPEQISGKQVTMPNTMRNKYLRETTKTMIVFTQILVDENGKTTKVKVLGTIPDDIRRLVEDTLLTWTFKPAMKDNVRVKVWIPKTLRFQF